MFSINYSNVFRFYSLIVHLDLEFECDENKTFFTIFLQIGNFNESIQCEFFEQISRNANLVRMKFDGS